MFNVFPMIIDWYFGTAISFSDPCDDIPDPYPTLETNPDPDSSVKKTGTGSDSRKQRLFQIPDCSFICKKKMQQKKNLDV